ncbi:GrpB family protein [Shewanella rhizosphaerae]|uniref:GrpB family protein n=1 Tax=Shewanella rhizosphaerae TaxID=2864207 RepID=UPI001C661C88|nr:GrpB family protein [Shewanella rhizosphaerae]QYK14555.1 GrpB family protein [Shewanella rhizosphaerae]
MARSIVVIDHQMSWHQAFKVEKAQLLTALGKCVVSLEHIGSTSVPGLAAKPIIDMLLEVDSLAALDAQGEHLRALSYIARGENGIIGRRYFCKSEESKSEEDKSDEGKSEEGKRDEYKVGPQRTHHLHAFQSGSQQLIAHRAFRDYLIAHPDKADEYAELKRIAAKACHHDSEAYMAAKAGFMKETLALALCWYGKV